jgi:hypothetical protein
VVKYEIKIGCIYTYDKNKDTSSNTVITINEEVNLTLSTRLQEIERKQQTAMLMS